MPLFNPTSLKLPELTEVLSASRGSIIYFDDPDGVARTQEEMFESGSLLMSNNLFISSSQTKITASDTFEVDGGDVYLHNNLYVTGTSTFQGNSAFTNNVTIAGNLTIEGTSTTVDTQNLTIEDPMIMLASNGTSANQNGGLAILSGSSVTDQSLVIGRVANDMWGVGRLDVTGGTTNDLSSMTPVSFKSSELVLSSGVISGSSDKAFEFTATGQLKTIGSAKTATANQLLKYDGTHWVNTSLSAGDNISLDGLSISSRSTVTVTVAGGKFVIDGTSQQTLSLAKGVVYYFDQSHSTNSSHPLRFSTTSDGTHNSGAQYTTGVSFAGAPGSAGAYTKVILEQDAPNVLYYYCSAHSGMGGRSENAPAALLIGDRTFQNSLTVSGDLNTTDIISSTGVISGSNDKAIEFDANGNVTRLTVANPSQHNVLAYDGSKWVASASLGAGGGGGGGIDTEAAQDAAASLFTGGSHSNISFTYDDANNVIDADVSISDAMTVTYAPELVYARMKLSANYTAPYNNNAGLGTGVTYLPFDTVDVDTTSGNILTDPSNDRFIIPAGVTKVRLKASAYSSSHVTGEMRVSFYKNGSGAGVSYAGEQADTVGPDVAIAYSSVIDVVQGDYLQALIYTYNSNRVIDSSVTTTWFEMEVVEGSILNTTVASTITDFSANKLTLSQGVISGSSNKAIEFDSLGNITTLTTGSVSTNDFLKYDGTKWVAETTDAMTITYAPSSVYAKMYLATTVTSGLTVNNYNVVPFDTELADTSPNSDMVDLTNNRLKVPAGVTKVKLKASVYLGNTLNHAVYSYIKHYRGGVALTDPITSFPIQDHDGGGEVPAAFTGIIDVQQGDEFEYVVAINTSLSGVSIQGTNTDSVNRTWFEIEVVEGSILNKTVASTLPNAMSITYAPSSVYARMSITTNVAATGGWQVVPFDTEDIDTSPSSNLVDLSNKRFTIPTGVTKVMLRSAYQLQSDPGGTAMQIFHYRSSTAQDSPTSVTLVVAAGGSDANYGGTGIIDVQQGDYFELKVSGTSGYDFVGSATYDGSRNFFEIEVVEGSILNTTVASTITDFSTNKLTLTEGVISGSSNKAIEFDSLGNITTLTTGSAVQHNVLAYDGTKWVASASLGSAGLDTEAAQDAAASLFTGGTHDNITFTYDDSNNVINTAITALSANKLTLSQGVISGSSNKAIEFDALGNITTLTTGSVSTNDFLKYDGTKWVAATTDAMTVTYAPSPVYATIYRTASYSLTGGAANYTTVPWNVTHEDTFPSGGAIDLTNNRLVVPAGVTKVKLSVALQGGNTTSEPGRLTAIMRHYNSSNVLQTNRPIGRDTQEVTSWDYVNISTAIISVSQGDYFDIGIHSDTNQTILAINSGDPRYNFFTMEVVEGSILNKTVATTLPNAMSITYAPSPVYARIYTSSAQSIAPYTNTNAITILNLDTEDVDTSPSSNLVDLSNKGFKIPAGVTKIRAIGSAHSDTNATGEFDMHIIHQRAGSNVGTYFQGSSESESDGGDRTFVVSSIIDVQENDTITAGIAIWAGGTRNFPAGNKWTWLEIEVVEGSILNTTVASTITDFSTNKLTLTEGVISGSNDKAIEFDTNGNITSFGQSTPSQHDLLAYDGTKWVATGSINQFFELDGNGDLMPI